MSSRGPDWDFYQCKCGNILFEYNVVTGEKFMSETWSRCTATCMTPVTHVPTHTSPFPPMPIGPPKEKVSTGTETDEVLTDSCSCTSNTVSNETKHATNCCGEKVENSTSTNEEPSVGSALTQTSTLDTTGSNGLHFEETLTKTTDLKPSASLPSDAILEAPVDKTVCEKVINRGLETNGKAEDNEEVEKAIHEKENEKECEIEKMGTKEMEINNENDDEAVGKQGSGKMEDEIEKVENETKEKENEVKLEEENELENETEKMKDNKTKNEGIEAMETETEKEKPENEETKEQESKILEVDSSNDKTAKDDDVAEKESTEIEKEKKEIEENETQEISDAKKEVDDKQDKEESKHSEPSEEVESKEKTPERKTRSSTRNKSSKQTPTKPSPGKTLRKRKAETEETEKRTPVTRTQYPRRSPRLNVTKKRKTR